ncbi:MAG TPA: thiamine phosphate synthase [Nevskiaceae bacterium]|nr:thiamine phosphate synthase [Nevskiaceae bacterium]
MTATPLQRLYPITSAALLADEGRLAEVVAVLLAAGVRRLQYRDKTSDRQRRERLAGGLCQTLSAQGASLIINDDVELARAVGAAGVHLGAGDGDLAAARARLGPQALIGATCGASLARAEQARAAGADVLAFGRFYPSRTKPDAPAAPLAVLGQARARLGTVTLCAIGGITPLQAPALIAAGADWLAVIDALFGQPDPAAVEQACQAFARALANSPAGPR